MVFMISKMSRYRAAINGAARHIEGLGDIEQAHERFEIDSGRHPGLEWVPLDRFGGSGEESRARS
jgi:hypothetical protein